MLTSVRPAQEYAWQKYGLPSVRRRYYLQVLLKMWVGLYYTMGILWLVSKSLNTEMPASASWHAALAMLAAQFVIFATSILFTPACTARIQRMVVVCRSGRFSAVTSCCVLAKQKKRRGFCSLKVCSPKNSHFYKRLNRFLGENASFFVNGVDRARKAAYNCYPNL